MSHRIVLKELSKDTFALEFGRLFKKHETDKEIVKFLANLVASAETADELSARLQFLQEFANYLTSSVTLEDRPSLFHFIYTQVKLDLEPRKDFVTDTLKQATDALCFALDFGYKEVVRALQP